MVEWNVNNGIHHIRVKIRARATDLFIDGRLADSQKGFFSCSLISKLPEGNSVRAVITVGPIRVFCYIYIDDVKIFEGSGVSLVR
jgi:hypothetical protein